MPNRLASENSPYLLQHKDNPVDWYPWGEEALSKARSENKPIFLSIGYTACHWCHVMEHESFEDEDIARYMNEHFVNVKVDREERPDIDSIYMKAVVAMTGQGGWPMSVFLTPYEKPFFGGTYYPPVRRYNMPSFLEVLQHIAHIWNNEQEKIDSVTEQLIEYIRSDLSTLPTPTQTNISPAMLDQAALEITKSYDWKNGGWGKAPKFPQPMTIEFLLRKGDRGDSFAIEMAEHALIKLSSGGMYDLVGGGFSRYSVDNIWLIPHFEKMLYDNAQLASVYLYAYTITKNQVYLDICQKTLDFVASELYSPEGGFYSSLDADSEGEEGTYYIWQDQEIDQIISDPSERKIFKTAYNITHQGNFEGANVLQQYIDIDQLSSQFDLDRNQIKHILTENLQKLYKHRQLRIRPQTDDKVLAGWNGMMLFTFSEAARYLGDNRYRDIAVRNADFILTHLYKDGVLCRSWRLGQAKHAGTLEDYSAIILGLISLYYTDRNVKWFNAANNLTNRMVLMFDDPAGGFFDTSLSESNLIIRPKDVQDNAVPSGNAMAVQALLHISALTGNSEWRKKAELSIQQTLPLALQYPTAFAKWLCAVDTLIVPLKEIALVYADEDLNYNEQYKVVWSAYAPNQVVASSQIEAINDGPALLHHKRLLNNQSTAFICANFVCSEPVNSAAELKKQLSSSPVQ